MKVTPVETAEDIKRCYKVMHQLRPHLLDETAFVEQVQRQIKDGYHLVMRGRKRRSEGFSRI